MIALLLAAALAPPASGAPSVGPNATAPLAPPTPASAAANPGADRMICKHMGETGTRLPGSKECHTRAEWDELNAASRDDTNSYQQRSNQSHFSPN